MYQYRNYNEIQHEKDVAHDRIKIEKAFHSGIVPKSNVNKIFKEWIGKTPDE